MMLTGMTFPKCISVCVCNLTCGLYVFITCLLVCAGNFRWMSLFFNVSDVCRQTVLFYKQIPVIPSLVAQHDKTFYFCSIVLSRRSTSARNGQKTGEHKGREKQREQTNTNRVVHEIKQNHE